MRGRSLGERLGEAAGTLKDALAQIRLAYVELARAGEAGGTAPPTPDGTRGPAG